MRGPPVLRCACSPCSTDWRGNVGPEADAARREARATSEQRAPRTDGPLMHFASPRGEKCELIIALQGKERQLHAVINLQLFKNVPEVVSDSLSADLKGFRYFLVAVTLRHKGCNLALPGRERTPLRNVIVGRLIGPMPPPRRFRLQLRHEVSELRVDPRLAMLHSPNRLHETTAARSFGNHALGS